MSSDQSRWGARSRARRSRAEGWGRVKDEGLLDDDGNDDDVRCTTSRSHSLTQRRLLLVQLTKMIELLLLFQCRAMVDMFYGRDETRQRERSSEGSGGGEKSTRRRRSVGARAVECLCTRCESESESNERSGAW